MEKLKSDPRFLAVREKGLKRAFFMALMKHSKTRKKRNNYKSPSEEGESRQQKKHFVGSAFSNGRGWSLDLRLP